MKASKPSFNTKELVLLALCVALIFVLQVAMSGLPNIEPVTLLIILYTHMFRRKTLYIIYGFAFLEGFMYGFHIWWIMYLYVWTVLWLVITLMPRKVHPLLMATVAGIFGLAFGALCSIPYLFLGGSAVALGWWVAGIPYDIIHGVSNFLIVLLLYAPLDSLTDKLMIRLNINNQNEKR